MKKFSIISVVVVALGLLAFMGGDGVTIPLPEGWPAPVYNFRKHPLTAKKIELGRMLFNDPALSGDSTISCTSCHSQYNAFTHIDHSLSHGIGGKIGNRNTPALMNLAWRKDFMWDGAVKHLDEQARLPITNPLEMDETMPHVAAKLRAMEMYRTMFRSAFNKDTITGAMVQQALAQYMLTLVSANAKYDRVKNGTDTFTMREANGYALFKANCSACHSEPLFTNDGFENNGLVPDSELHDNGRIAITGAGADAMKFKVPTLRNIEVTYPYMHDGRFRNLQMVLHHYTTGIQQSTTLSGRLRGVITLTEQEKKDIVLFLKTLTDEDFLKNRTLITATIKPKR